MKTFVFIGGNSDVALHSRALLEASGHNIISVSRTVEGGGKSHLYGDPVQNDLPEIDEQIDGLVYFPGSITLKPFRSMKQADLQSDLEINVLGAFHSIQRYLPKMNEGSSIVLFSTVAVQTGMPFHSSVAVSKGAIEGMTRALAAEFAPKIRVNCIAPSLTNTKLASKFLSSPEKAEASAQRHPLKKVGTVDDLSGSLLFLLGETSSWMTGQVLHVDGGLSSLRV